MIVVQDEDWWVHVYGPGLRLVFGLEGDGGRVRVVLEDPSDGGSRATLTTWTTAETATGLLGHVFETLRTAVEDRRLSDVVVSMPSILAEMKAIVDMVGKEVS